jgi:hypothetical protein
MIIRATATVIGLAMCLAVTMAEPASAHEERTIGRYHVAVGFGDEPAYAGVENSVQMFIHDARDRPVTDLGDTLQVQVQFGDQRMPPMTMQPNFEVGESGIPSDYRAFFFPTRPGRYTFHFTGSIKGQKVDASFTSGPQTFDEVKDAIAAEFPAKDPTTGQLAARLDREVPRLNAALAEQAREAKHDSNRARLFGIVGTVIGVLGLGVGGVALARARRRPAGSAAERVVAETASGRD